MKRARVVMVVLAVMGFGALAAAPAEKGKAKIALPAAVAKAVEDNCPNAVIEKTDLENEAGINLYDIEFKGGLGEIEVAEDGTVMDISTVVEKKDVPGAAFEAFQKAAEGAVVGQIERSEVWAELIKQGEKARIVKLDKPTFIYEAEIVKGDQTSEIQVAPDGTIVEALKWRGRGEASD